VGNGLLHFPSLAFHAFNWKEGLIEQNARMALRLAHEAYILELGRVAIYGKAKDLIHNEDVRKAYLGSG